MKTNVRQCNFLCADLFSLPEYPFFGGSEPENELRVTTTTFKWIMVARANPFLRIIHEHDLCLLILFKLRVMQMQKTHVGSATNR